MSPKQAYFQEWLSSFGCDSFSPAMFSKHNLVRSFQELINDLLWK